MIGESAQPVLSIRNLSKSYGDLKAVNNLTLDIYRGEIFGFLGPNGAGKTTTIKMICGLLKADKGTIEVNGQSLVDNYRSCKKKMGLCPQELVIWESLTCMEQLVFMGHFYNLGRDKAHRRAQELLDILGLAHKKSKLAKTLSGGMKRRLNIALALVHEPEILILDEPQAGLDPQSRILVRDYIRSLAKSITVVLTTHDMDEAERLSNRIAIIDHGQLLVLDTAEQLKQQIGEGDFLEITLSEPIGNKLPDLKKTLPRQLGEIYCHENNLRLLGTNLINDIPTILETFKKLGLTIKNASIRGITLEDVFIHLTGRRLRE